MRLDDVPREWLLALALALASYAIWAWLGGALRRARMQRRFERAAEGEREAGPLLEQAGFRIEAAQALGGYSLLLDGQAVAISVRADYLVSRRGARYVAEVKTGNKAPRIETAATRRQLLDYQHAFDVDGVLLVDADARLIHHVEFPRRGAAIRWPIWAFAAALFAIAIACARVS